MNAKFTVIKGGKQISDENTEREFIAGYATNTRLMGVIGMELQWKVTYHGRPETFYQIFYLDAEEFGLESYTEDYGNNPEKIKLERRRLLGALGGDVITVTEAEARFILQSYIKINDKFKQNMPEGYQNYSFLLSPVQELTLDEYDNLFSRLCGTVNMPYFVINYFLMRTFANDRRGCAFLTLPQSENKDLLTVTPDYRPDSIIDNLYTENHPSALCRNTIEHYGVSGSGRYLCESVIEYNGTYHIVTSELQLQQEPCRVIHAEQCSSFPITPAEAAMVMNCSEFITVYEIDSQSFQECFQIYAETFTETLYETGRLYIDFYETNDHVGKQTFRMNDDIRAMYFLSDYDQLLVIAYSYEAVYEAELHVTLALMTNYMRISRKYEFREPILHEFLKSNFENFDEFLSVITGGPED